MHPASKQKVIYKDDTHTLRKNLIVMGDIIEDSKMPKDSEHENLLKIGFFNTTEGHATLEDFTKHFDLVISSDGSLCPVLYLLQNLYDH